MTEARINEFQQIRRSVIAWARQQSDIAGVALVGSWTRGTARMDSDIDFVLLTLDTDRYVTGHDWVTVALSQSALIVGTRHWGPLTERRVRLPSGLEVEFGFGMPVWATTDPVDPSTARVVRDGCIPLLDRDDLFVRLMEAV